MRDKTLHLTLSLPFVAFCAAELFFQSIFCVAITAALPLVLSALNRQRLLVGQRHYARTHPCEPAAKLMQTLGFRHHLATPPIAFITDLFGPAYTDALDALVVTPRWLETLDEDPDAAAAIVLHEMAHRQEISRPARYPVTLSLGTWPVLFVVATLCSVAALNAHADISILRLLLATAVPSLVYGLGFLVRAWASRALELRADGVAARAGYAPALIRLLNSPSHGEAGQGSQNSLHQFIYNLTSAHPRPSKRVGVLEHSLGQHAKAPMTPSLWPSPVSDAPGPLGTI
jgi:Zn-dependent protease with chaperone function